MQNFIEILQEMERMPCEVYMSELSCGASMRPEHDIGRIGKLHPSCIMEVVSRLPLIDAFAILGLLGKRIDAALKKRIENCRHIKTRMRNFPNYKPENLFEMGRNVYSLNIRPVKDKAEKVLNVLVPMLKGAATTGNLSSLILNNIQFTRVFAHALDNVIFQLNELDLNNCELIDEFLSYLLPKALNLRTLKLLGNDRLKGKFMRDLYKNSAGKCMLNVLDVELTKLWELDPFFLADQQKHMKITVFEKYQGYGVIYNSMDRTRQLFLLD